ncbi:MAG: NnrS family protein [Gammaproteobacteria bacterium]
MVCGFRPFYLASAGWALLSALLWLLMLGGALPWPATPGGAVVWHAHELLAGFVLAATAGFLLTAVPEFTATPAWPPRTVLGLLALWTGGRIAFLLSGFIGIGAAALFDLAFIAALLVLAAPRLWRDPERRHRSFITALALLLFVFAGFHADALRDVPPLRWLHLATGVVMILVILAMSRISMRIVNDALDERRAAGFPDIDEYLARPPRRNLAMFLIGLYSVVEFVLPGVALGGWLALATAAALLNLLNDWHVGRALLTRWPLLLYACYVLMAGGYTLIGLSLLDVPVTISAGRHLLTSGVMGLSIFVVFCIAGRRHAGYPLDERPWVRLAAGLIVAAALLRAAAGFPGVPVVALQHAAGTAWCLAFALVLYRLGPVWWGPRPDGGVACEELIEAQPEQRRT